MSEDECPNIAVMVVLGPGMREQYCSSFDQALSLIPVLILFISGLSNMWLCSSFFVVVILINLLLLIISVLVYTELELKEATHFEVSEVFLR